jgi:hypothetical protein
VLHTRPSVGVEVLLDLALLEPGAGSLIGITTPAPLCTTVERRAEYGVEIWSASKWRISENPSTSTYQATQSSRRPCSTLPTTWSMTPPDRVAGRAGRQAVGGEPGPHRRARPGAVHEEVPGLAVGGDGGGRDRYRRPH